MARARNYALQLLTIIGLCTATSAGHALVVRTPGSRAGTFEVAIAGRFQDSANYNFSGDARAHTDSSWGWGFNLGYNFTDHFNLSFDASADRVGYQAAFIPSGSSGSTTLIDGHLDTFTGHFNATWNFLSGPVTPFVTGGVGWTYVDSNIPSGPPEIGCWWSPWWGYVCTDFQDTRDENSLSWAASVGLRWDVTDSVFLRGSIGKMWVDLNNASGNPDINIGKVEVGFMY